MVWAGAFGRDRGDTVPGSVRRLARRRLFLRILTNIPN